MAQLKGTLIETYIMGMINLENWNEDVQDKTPAKPRKNNANSKWLKLSATSGRNPTFYKSMTFISFLATQTNNKEGVVLFRTMSSLGAGKNSIAFKDSPGEWYLSRIDKYNTCLISEFLQACEDLFANDLIPFQILEVAKVFMEYENMPENALNLARGLWGDTYKTLMDYIQKVDKLQGDNIGETMLRGFDKQIKKKINTSKKLKFIKQINKVKKGVKIATAITNPQIFLTRFITKKIVKSTMNIEFLSRMGDAVSQEFTSIIDKKFSNEFIKSSARGVAKTINVNSIDDIIEKII